MLRPSVLNKGDIITINRAYIDYEKLETLTQREAMYVIKRKKELNYTLEVSSFGTLSKLYCNLADNNLKKQIAREFGLPQHLYIESWIKSLSVLRNCIAHHARIWNRKYPWKPQLPKKLQNPWIQDKGISQEKLYAQLCCIAYLLDAICPNNGFKRNLKSLLTEYPIIDVAAMGFPKLWYNEPLWK